VIADGQRSHQLFRGAAAFVRQAAAAVPIAIASGALTHEMVAILNREGLHGLFVAVVGADQTSRRKPSPDPYLEAFHRITTAGHIIRHPEPSPSKIPRGVWSRRPRRDCGASA